MGSLEVFKTFVKASDYKEIISTFTDLCAASNVAINDDRQNIYENLKNSIQGHMAKSLFTILDKRRTHNVYADNKSCRGKTMVIVGAGPIGLRMAIEGALLGARVVVLEARDYFGRNNVLALWPFVVQDLRLLGTKVFCPKFCVGSIDHISIRMVQSTLLKVGLLLGVEIHAPVTFKSIQEPRVLPNGQVTGWRVELSDEIDSLANLDVDIIVGADGHRNSVSGFERKPFRGKNAIAITFNMVYRHTREESQIEDGGNYYNMNEDSTDKTQRHVCNFIYFRNETHYFVMAIPKEYLIEREIVKEDRLLADLLKPDNVDREKLREYAIEIANKYTDNHIPNMEFAKNHKGEEDLAMFDFSTMYQSVNASRVCERHNKRLLKCIVGDGLKQPFWPTGTGCGLGWLGLLDSAWMIKQYCEESKPLLEIIGARECLLGQLSIANPRVLRSNFDAYTIDPSSRYNYVIPPYPEERVKHLYDQGDTTH